jgi:hypothetical protein
LSALLLLVFILLKLLKTRESNITVCESDFIGLVVEILAVGCPSYYMYNNNNSDVAKVKGRGERKRERERGFGGGDGSGDGNLLSGGGFVVRSGEALLLTLSIIQPSLLFPPHTTTHTLITLDDDDDEKCVLTICILVELLQFV